MAGNGVLNNISRKTSIPTNNAMPQKGYVMIVAGEASGDLHGSQLVRSLKSLRPELEICGMGGQGMAAAGMELLCDISQLAVMGIAEVVSRLWDIRKAMRILEQRWQQQLPALLILIDYPGFNLILAARAKKLNIPVLYYISPKVWAWGRGRIKKIRRLVDRMAVILPFELDFYRKYGIEVVFVGNPLLDSVQHDIPKDQFFTKHDIEPGSTVVGILPGSRKQEIAKILPVFLLAAKRLQRQEGKIVFLLALAPGLTRADLADNGLGDDDLDIRVIAEGRYDLMAACDVVMAASGTVTLELAILNVPMVVAYRVASFTYLLGRLLVKVPFFSLVNLVAGQTVVVELLQQEATPKKICEELQRLLDDQNAYIVMKKRLKEITGQLGQPGASTRTARLALEMIDAS
jgi:lipid-A-disaccharide synthase